MKLNRCALVGTLLLCSGEVRALDPARAVTQYAHDVWSSRDGLPEGAVLSIHEAKDGYLWLGTECCLVRFDGQTFVQYEAGRLGLKQHSFVRDLLEAADHTLWAATVGGVARYSSGAFQWFAEEQGLAHPFVYGLALGSDGTVWIGTGGTGIWGLWQGRFAAHPAYRADPRLPAKVNGLVTDRASALWAATDEGIVFLGNDLQRFTTDQGLPSDVVNVVRFDHEGTLWAGTRRGLARLSPGSARFVYVPEPESVDVESLLEDRDHNLWIGTRSGLLKKTVDGIESEPSEHGGLYSLTEDRSGAIWVGTGEGLERYRDGAFATIGRKEGLQTEQILNIHTRRDGGLWVLDGSGAIWIEEAGRRSLIAEPGTVAGSGMLGMAEGSDGSLWIAANELMRYRAGEWQHFDHKGGGFSVVEADGDGLLVAQTDGDGTSRILRFNGHEFVDVPIDVPLSHVQRIYRDRSGRLWISTGGSGLIRVAATGTRVYRHSDGLPHDIVYGIAEDPDDSLWVATRAGIARVREDRVFGYAEIPGAPRRAPLHLYRDGAGFLWVTADDGVHRLSIAELNRVAAGESRTIGDQRFTTRDGLRSVEISWRCSAQAVTPDGRLHYATARGLAEVDPRTIVRSVEAPNVLIEGISLAGAPTEASGGLLSVSNRRERLEIHYSSPALLEPQRIEFRYRLLGFERDWVQAGSSRTAHYANLPAGDYVFSVSARRAGGDWQGIPTSLRIRVLPDWYETASARLAGLLALMLIAYGIYRLKVLQLRRSERILCERVRERTEALRIEVRERKAAEDRVRVLANDLEERVRQRTIELEVANLTARKNAERFDLAVRGAQDGIWDWDLVTGCLYLSPRWKAMLGYADNELESTINAWLSHVDPRDASALRRALRPTSSRAGHIRHEYRMLDRAGSELWVLCRGIVLLDEDGRPVRAAGSQSDVTQRKLSEAELRRNANHDALTGLPNRTLFADRLGQAMLRTRLREDSWCAVLLLDLDNFKHVNETLGHGAGDQLLVEFARRIRSCIQDTETAARLGGDEFAVLLPDMPNKAYATEVAGRIQGLLLAPIELGKTQVAVSASIGIKYGSPAGDELEDFIRDADVAMYRAKAEGKGRHQIFDVRMRNEAMERSRIEAGLRRGIEQGEMLLHFQPLVSLDTGKAVGVEALVRWNDPERGLTVPSAFISIAESSGLIVPLSEWVIAAACRQASEWQSQLGSPVRIAVNLPPVMLSDPQLASKIQVQLGKHGLTGAVLGIEIVETSILETNQAVLVNLKELQRMGVTISIDDFGTGYSSFGYLKRLPISYLKIDRSLTQNVPFDANDTAICNAILSMAAQLGLAVVAEGVETPEQAEFLRKSGCAMAQGYLYSRPLAAEECRNFLETPMMSHRTASATLRLVRRV